MGDKDLCYTESDNLLIIFNMEDEKFEKKIILFCVIIFIAYMVFLIFSDSPACSDEQECAEEEDVYYENLWHL